MWEQTNGKPRVNMTYWELYVYSGRYNLSGVADAHPRLGRNVHVAHTSGLQKYSLEDDVLTYETWNTVYVCPLKYMTRYPYKNVVPEYKEKLAHRAEQSGDWLDRIIEATAKIALETDDGDEFVRHIRELQEEGQTELQKKEDEENKRLFEVAAEFEDCIYMEVTSISQGNKLAYHLGKDFGIIKPSIHVGTFQDSILYCKYGSEDEVRVDFRYFPMAGDVMETYSWSDNIKLAVIKNDCQWEISFNHQMIQPGETKVFTADQHEEGLISPDCYNGKSVFNPSHSDEV